MNLEPDLVFSNANSFINTKIMKFISIMKASLIYSEDIDTTYRVWFTNSIYYGTKLIILNEK